MKKLFLLSLWLVPFLVFGQGITFSTTGYFPGNVTAGGTIYGTNGTYVAGSSNGTNALRFSTSGLQVSNALGSATTASGTVVLTNETYSNYSLGSSSLFSVTCRNSAPAAPTVANSVAAGTNVTGTVKYKVAWSTDYIFGDLSPATTFTPDGIHKVYVEKPGGTPPSWATRWSIFRTKASGSSYYKLNTAILGASFWYDDTPDSQFSTSPSDGESGNYAASVGRRIDTSDCTTYVLMSAYNCAFGPESMYYPVGYGNCAFGRASLQRCSGNENTAVGGDTLTENTWGFGNSALGSGALKKNLGNWNTAVGLAALIGLVTGDDNVAVGDSCLGGVTNASWITAIGHDIGGNALGNGHTLIGSKAAEFMSAGVTYNICLGMGAGNHATNSYELFIDSKYLGSAGANYTNSLIYGSMSSSNEAQVVRVNGAIEVPLLSSEPTTPTTNYCKIYSCLNGAGKYILVSKFPDGSTNVFCTQSVTPNIAIGGTKTLNDTNLTYLLNVDANIVTLPTAVGINGKTYTIKLITPATVGTVTNATGAETIDGALSYSLSASNKFVTVQSSGTNWWIIGNN